LQDFTAAVERIVAGLEKRSRILNPYERSAVAYHEMGHALVALSQPGSDPVHKVSIIPRGVRALGYTIQRPTEDRYLMTEQELQHKVCVLLGGRAAEKLMLGSLSTGAADDLAKATQIAREMVMRYGMNEQLGCVSFDSLRSPMVDTPLDYLSSRNPVAELTQQHIDNAVHTLVMSNFETALAFLKTNRDVLERGAQALLEHETLDASALAELAQSLVPVARPSQASAAL
jgi:cell division protease FtsH